MKNLIILILVLVVIDVTIVSSNSESINEMILNNELNEQKLPDNFLRIHRGIIINKDFVKDIQKYFNSRYTVTLNDSELSSVTSGRSYNAVIKDWVDA